MLNQPLPAEVFARGAVVVCVPATEDIAGIERGAAIVVNSEVYTTTNSDDQMVRAYIEANVYGAVNLVTFADFVAVAAGRLLDNYPTSAVRALPRHDLCPVAVWSLGDRRLTGVGENWRPMLSAWLGRPVDDKDLRLS
jgi:hypothetical protein